MEVVAAALGYHVYLPAGAAAIFSRRHTGLNGELLNSVGDAEIIQIAVYLGVHVADAVPHVDIGLRTGPGDVKTQNLRTGRRWENPWRDKREVKNLAGIQWHVRNRAGADHAAQCTLVVLQQRRNGFYLYRFGEASHLERQLQMRYLIYLH